jgi:hypothetical protein
MYIGLYPQILHVSFGAGVHLHRFQIDPYAPKQRQIITTHVAY